MKKAKDGNCTAGRRQNGRSKTRRTKHTRVCEASVNDGCFDTGK